MIEQRSGAMGDIGGGGGQGGTDVASASLSAGGANIPLLGFGTYGMSGPELQNVLVAALRAGFRHIDTAQMYQNESDVGFAIRASGVPRSDVFVTTKVWVGNYPRSRFMASVDESLRKLQTDWLIQQPRVVALSRTQNVERIAANARVFDFALSEEDMTAITHLRAPGSRIVDPPHLTPAWD